jgi:hypothetical protein
MAQMRSAGIRVFGILLNVGSDTDKDEAFYRSLMQPVIEEKGQVTSGSGLPSGEITCGENLPAEERDYATGAFLEAQSAADIAYKLIDVSIGPSTKVDCSKNGEFWVDPGIDAVEFATDASAWRITDAKGVVRASWSGSQKTTTGKIAIPDVKEPEKWKFTPAGASKICSLYVSPEIYMSLHDKSLISGKQGSITGQFVKSLTSNQIADLSVYKSVAFSAQIDGKAFDSSLNKKTGTFEIKSYTPPTSSESAKVQATLTLKTDHYNLNTLNLDKSKDIYSAGVLPEVGSIKFVSDLIGAKGKATAEVTIKAPTAQGVSSNVCFTSFKVISDGQDESAGKATDRSKNWNWTTGSLDANGCIEFLNGTNRDQKVTFDLSNPTQANAKGEALFNYKISSGDIADLKDSQTAGFGTQAETNSLLFWFLFFALLFVGLAIPFGILTAFNRRNAVILVPVGTTRAEFEIRLDTNEKTINLVLPEDEDLDVQATSAFFPLGERAKGGKEVTEPEGKRTKLPKLMKFSAKAPLWPLSQPHFSAASLSEEYAIFLHRIAKGLPKKLSNAQALKDGNVSRITYIAIHGKLAAESLRHGKQVQGSLVVFSQRSPKAAELNKKLVNTTISDEHLIKSISEWLSSFKIKEPQQQDGTWDLNKDQAEIPDDSNSNPNSAKSDKSGFSWDL